jgi:energy-coupling factor transport system permease protein
MLKDITIGQYFEGKSFLHRLEARTKIIITLLFIIMLFLDSKFYTLMVGFAFVAIAVYLSDIKLKFFFKSIKPILPILIITAIFNLIFIDGGDVLFSWKFIKITDHGISNSAYMIVRIILLVIGCSLLTYTTTPIELTNAIEKLLSPLKKFHFPVHELATMMTIALRFIPTLIEETEKIISAQKARGADFENGKIKDKVRAIIPILVPLFISSFRRAEELATAMECRCYNGGEGRTRMRKMEFHARDIISICVTLMFICVVISLKIIIRIEGEI